MLEICIPSSIEYLPLVDSVCQAFCIWAGVSCHATDEISMATIEAATNAVVHGNRCEKSRKVRVILERSHSEITVTVIDEGSGFDPETVACPVDEENLLKESGRGIYIMRQAMDAVQFECRKAGGTKVRMVKQLEPRTKRRILCIDYGQKRLGMALSDELCLTAQPLGKIEVDSEGEQIKEIGRVARDNDVGEIVVGLPLTLRGEIAQAASRVTAFARALNQHLCLPVITWDERLSTKQGEQVLIKSGMRRKKRREVVDSVAAAIILQSYLDARRKK